MIKIALKLAFLACIAIFAGKVVIGRVQQVGRPEPAQGMIGYLIQVKNRPVLRVYTGGLYHDYPMTGGPIKIRLEDEKVVVNKGRIEEGTHE